VALSCVRTHNTQTLVSQSASTAKHTHMYAARGTHVCTFASKYTHVCSHVCMFASKHTHVAHMCARLRRNIRTYAHMPALSMHYDDTRAVHSVFGSACCISDSFLAHTCVHLLVCSMYSPCRLCPCTTTTPGRCTACLAVLAVSVTPFWLILVCFCSCVLCTRPAGSVHALRRHQGGAQRVWQCLLH